MAIEVINIGTTVNDGTGDTARAAGTKINANFSEVAFDISALKVASELTFGLTSVDGSPIITASGGSLIITLAGGIYGPDTFGTDVNGVQLSVDNLALGPMCLVKPLITGTLAEGDVLTIRPALWLYSGTDPDNVANQMQNDGVNISGATALTYTIAATDAGDPLTNVETFGGSTVTSNPVTADAVAFVPSSLASLVDDSDAGVTPTTITDIAGKVSEWANSGPGANSFVQTVDANRPQTGLTPQNGLNVLTYTAGNWLQDTTAPAFSTSGTLFLVFKNDSTAASTFTSVYAADGGTYDFQIQTGTNTSGDWFGGVNSTAHSLLQRATTTGKAWVIQAYRWDLGTTTADYWTNGTMDDQVTDYTTGYDAMTAINVGSNRATSFGLVGKLAQVWRFDAALTPSQMSDMFTYAGNRWNITLDV